MKTRLWALGSALIFLAACGQGGGRSEASASNEACALIADASAIFGADPNIVANAGDAPIAAVCQFSSADGTRSGEVLLFNADSMGGANPADQLATLAQAWDGATETPLQPIANLGDEAQLATDLPGYQTQIVFRQGANVVAVLGSSGDARKSAEQIARALAAAAASSLATP